MTPDDRDRFTAIVNWLRPGSLKTTTECSECGGCGKNTRPPVSVCKTCFDRHGLLGRGVVFRSDEEGRRLIAKAVKLYNTNADDGTLDSQQRAAAVAITSQNVGKYHLRVWDNRAGQPWEDAITKHVATYVADPPDFSTLEGCERLKRMLREAGIWYSVQFDPNEAESKHHWALVGKQRRWLGDDTEADALIAACEAAMPKATVIQETQSQP